MLELLELSSVWAKEDFGNEGGYLELKLSEDVLLRSGIEILQFEHIGTLELFYGC